jgi:hypothetical protein
MTQGDVSKFLDLETSLHKKEIRNSREKVSEFIADDFVEFGKSGNVFHKQDTLDGLEEESVDLNMQISDFEVKELSPNVVLVMYMSSTPDSALVRRSSIWVYRDERWQMIFHQGTRI